MKGSRFSEEQINRIFREVQGGGNTQAVRAAANHQRRSLLRVEAQSWRDGRERSLQVAGVGG
jgi:hypothetical protein